MHRIRYTKLTEERISQLLGVLAPGPRGDSQPHSNPLAGRSLRIVTDDGPVLDYTFSSGSELTLAEGNGSPVRGGYGALELKQLVLFSHLLPGTQRGYTVVLDQDTELVTVFEMWFSGYTDNREVQREIYHGYVDNGGEAPAARHRATNRLEGKGFHWTQDNGVETLEFYPSILYSNFVELTRFGGELSFCAPSDYVQLTEEQYLYSRVEAEFSGTMTLYVLNLFDLWQMGVRLGFDQHDAPEFYLFTGTGEMLGQLAQFEPFGDYDVPGPGGPQGTARKGQRRVYRPLQTNPVMTQEEVEAAVARNTAVFASQGGMAGNKLPPTDHLVGRQLAVRYDSGGPVIQYRFDDIQTLRWRFEGDTMWRQERYEAWEPAGNVVMFAHLLSGTPRHDCVNVVVDFDNGLTSCMQGMLGTPYMANEASVQTWFGVVEMEGLTPPTYRRHQFTDELAGRALTWHYSPGLTSMHLYSTPHSLSWIIFLGNGAGGLEWSGPAQYVKIRDGLYLLNWVEEACNGTLGTIVVNTRTMHDCGTSYHVGPEGLRLSAVGAHSRNAGQYDVARFYRVGQA
jgi:hypothetical protein